MTDHPTGAPALCRLDDLGVLRFRGADAGSFLQGQLSNDLSRLRPDAILRAGLHTPQGRALVLPWLAAADGDILAVLPRELAAGTAAQMRRYVLRARLTITDESDRQQVLGLHLPARSALPGGSHRLDAERAVMVRAVSDESPDLPTLSREQWRALDIAAGIPQIYQATTGQFVAQMLNLDCIDAISFTKGCYTGQEVIARAHYRGRVKRRMQRFETVSPARLAPGDAGHLDDGRAYRVVEAVTRADGRCEFLAVAPLSAGAREDSPEGGAKAADASAAAPLGARALPLPYPLPE